MKQSHRLKNIVTQPNAELLFGRVVPASKILVLAPHCDDEALGFGGNIIKYLNEKKEVLILFLSSDSEKRRVREVQEAWKGYQNLSFIFLDYPDSRVCEYHKAATEEIVKAIRTFQPELIGLPWYFDKHIDHVECNIILYHVIKQLLYTEAMSRVNIISYEVNFPLYINYCVNISDVFEEKARILKKYESQKPDTLIRRIEALNRFRGEQNPLRCVKYAEALYVCSPKEYMELIEMYISDLEKD